VVPNQIKTGSAEDGRPHDLVLLATTNPDYLDPPLFFTDYDVVVRREEGGDHDNTGVLVIDLPVKILDDWEVTDGAGSALMTLMGTTGGQILMAATVIGDQGANDNLVFQNKSTSSRVAVIDSLGTSDILRVTDDGAGGFSTRVSGPLAFTGTSTTGTLPSIASSSNRLDLRGGSTSIRFLNNAFSAVNLAISDAGELTLRNATTHSDGSGTPEGVVTAPVGSTFHRTDGGAGTSFYVKESGAGNTGWVAK
jgi:hypothetical protein